MTVSATVSNTTNPKASVGLILEKYIFIAYLAKANLCPYPFLLRPDAIDPDISKQITEFRIL